MKIKELMFKILNGMSLGIVATLIPSAILGEIAKSLNLASILNLTRISTSLLPFAIGTGVSYQLSFTPLESICVSVATFIGSGVVSFVNGNIVLTGTGDVVNAGVTAFIASLAIYLFRDKVKGLSMVALPIIISTAVGWIGLNLLPYVSKVNGVIGLTIEEVVKMQPLLTGGIIAIIFSILIISPFSTVGIALAVNLSGIAAGAANLGVCAAAFGLALAGLKVNPIGITLVPVLGSAKIQMANFVKNPLIIVPIVINAFTLGVLGALFNIKGTAFSAGFGISGLIGPINALNHLSWNLKNIVLVFTLFIILPIIFGYICNFIFINKLVLIKEEDYKVTI
ncbi:PTS sugar transporter subunit IIC [Cetobacterium somerae]|uniref:PTS transporter subunit IIC n=1 Tax=Cetobacterium somerae TaxID=188913 RepID=UPI001F0689B3|nr:PTS sugar transporter subunit IIC [Cetobacterium somerae]UPO97516.1 PTS sugar transporter subunit IIC [Cetobacterium somerae]